MTNAYLLKVEENSGEDTFTTHHLIKAEDVQKVKYHFHRTLKDWGYRGGNYDKHYLKRDHLGAEIASITPLTPSEFHTMDKFMHHWTKV